MKVLVRIKSDTADEMILVTLNEDCLITRVRELVNQKLHNAAIEVSLECGDFEKEVFLSDLPELIADLILSENSARWDMK